MAFDVNYGPSAMILDGVNGFLVPPNDVEQMASRMIEILTNRDLHAHLVSQANPSVQGFSDEHVSTLWRVELERLVAQPSNQISSNLIN